MPGLGKTLFAASDETYRLPTTGLHLTQALSPKRSVTKIIGGIGLSIDNDFEGTLIEALNRFTVTIINPPNLVAFEAWAHYNRR